jgi:hypothetical protein
MGTLLRLLATAVLTFAWTASAAAQTPPPALKGVVRDQFGSPVPGVVLRIATPDQSVVRVAATDLRGEYKFDRLASRSDYAMEVSHPHFRKVTIPASGDSSEVDVQLKARRKCGSQKR